MMVIRMLPLLLEMIYNMKMTCMIISQHVGIQTQLMRYMYDVFIWLLFKMWVLMASVLIEMALL